MRVVRVNSESPLSGILKVFVEKHSVLFNSDAWLSCYPEENIVRCAIVNKNEEVIGCFVYYSYKKAFTNFVITPPFTPTIDLFYINPSESVVGKNTFNKEMGAAIAAYLTDLKVGHLELSLPQHVNDTQSFAWSGLSVVSKFTYVLSLIKTESELWENLSSEKRKSINKAIKDGIEVSETNDYQTVYDLVVKSLTRNGVHKNDAVLRNIILNHSQTNNSICYVARKNGLAIGATYCLIYKQTAFYLFGGFSSDNKHHGAGVSCMWHSILKAKKTGLIHFDFEGSMNPSIERYFREFGGELVRYAVISGSSLVTRALFRIKKGVKGK